MRCLSENIPVEPDPDNAGVGRNSGNEATLSPGRDERVFCIDAKGENQEEYVVGNNDMLEAGRFK